MFRKEAHTSPEFKCGELLQKKYRESVEQGDTLPRKKNREVNTSKLNDILIKIGPLIPAECLEFWKELPTDNLSKDLTVNFDHLDREMKTKTSSDKIVNTIRRQSGRKST